MFISLAYDLCVQAVKGCKCAFAANACLSYMCGIHKSILHHCVDYALICPKLLLSLHIPMDDTRIMLDPIRRCDVGQRDPVS